MVAETAVLPRTPSLDCFSDGEVDIYEPPVASNYIFEEIAEVPSTIEKINFDVELSGLSGNKLSAESRELEDDILKGGDIEIPRETNVDDSGVQEDTQIKVASFKEDEREAELDAPGMVEPVKSYRSIISVGSKSSKGVADALIENKLTNSLESKNGPTDSVKVESTPTNMSQQHVVDCPSDPIGVTPPITRGNSNLSEKPKTISSGSETGILKVPTVSFADDTSEKGKISRKGSGVSAASKKSNQTKTSMFSLRKSKSKDPDEITTKPSLSESAKMLIKENKSIKSGASGKPPVVPLVICKDSFGTTLKEEAKDTTQENPEVDKLDIDIVENNREKPIATNDEVTADKAKQDNMLVEVAGIIVNDPGDVNMNNQANEEIFEEDAAAAIGTVVPTPEVAPVPPTPPERDDQKSKRRWSSGKSLKSIKSLKLPTVDTSTPIIKTTRSLEVISPTKLPSPSFSPKLIGPPKRLPRWGGITKSVKSEKRAETDKPASTTSVRPKLETSEAENAPATFQDEPLGEKKSNERDPIADDAIADHCLDATSTLSSKSSKEIDDEPPQEEDLSRRSNHEKLEDVDPTEEISHAKSYAATEENNTHVTAEKENNEAKEVAEEEKPSTTDAGLDISNEVAEPLTVLVDNVEADPIKAVMEPFSPVNVPFCTTAEDIILKIEEASTTCLPSDPSVEKTSDNEPEDEPHPVAGIEKNCTDTKRKSRDMRSLFRPFGKSKPVKVLNDKSNSLTIETNDPELEAKKTKGGFLPSGILSGVLSPKKPSILESDNEFEVIKRDSPKKRASPKSTGMFKRNTLGSPKKMSTNTEHSENKVDLEPDSEIDPIMVPLATIPVVESMNNAVVNTDVTEEPEAVENPSISKKSVKNSTITSRKIPGFFGRLPASNEKKRIKAKAMKVDHQHVTPKRKELDVKLSAMIDENVLVENLHVPYTPKVANATLGIEVPSDSSSKCVGEKVEDEPAPIIVVDHRSSKKVETIGKFEQVVPEEGKKPVQINVKTSEGKDDKVYTSDDTVTDTELTELAKLDVPYVSNEQNNVPMKVETCDDHADNDAPRSIQSVTTVVDDKKNDEQQSEHIESSWMNTIVDWCTPKASDVNRWIDCGIQEKSALNIETQGAQETKVLEKEEVQETGTGLLDEVVSEFNECHSFYASVLSPKNQGLNEDSSQQKKDQVQPPVDWSAQIMEWMSPKSKIVYSDENISSRDNKLIVQELEAQELECTSGALEAVVSVEQEGTEIALTNSDHVLASRENTQKGKSFKGMFVKPAMRSPFRKSKSGTPNETKVASSSISRKSASKLKQATITIREKRAPRFGTLFRKNALASTNHKEKLLPVVETNTSSLRNDTASGDVAASIPDIPAANQEAAVTTEAKLKEVKIPTDIETNKGEFMQPIKEDIPTDTETKTLLEKDCCGPDAEKIVRAIDGEVDDETSQQNNNLHHLIAGQPVLEHIDQDIENSVHYLSMIKSKRQARRTTSMKQEAELFKQNEKPSESVQEKSAQEIINDLTEAKPELEEQKRDHEVSRSEFQYRVNAVSDEDVENLSFTSSSMNGKVSFFTADTNTEPFEVSEVPVTQNNKKNKLEKLSKQNPIVPNKKAIQQRRGPVRAFRRKEEDSVGVSVYSANKSFDDDLSVAFAPKVGKWLW